MRPISDRQMGEAGTVTSKCATPFCIKPGRGAVSYQLTMGRIGVAMAIFDWEALMKVHNMILIAMIASATATAAELAKETRYFEMRTYYAAANKLPALQKRFRDHTLKLFEKHGMTNIGYWTPLTNTENKLVYILAYPNREARESSWKSFIADPEWQSAFKASEKAGKLVQKMESVFLNASEFSPVVTPVAIDQPRVFELRQYTCIQGRLPNLLARFRDHTLKLFEKHGMTNIGYWTPVDRNDQLVYILAHKSLDAQVASFKEFRVDPEWIVAKKSSEDEAGGSLTATNGVKSTLLVPTDFSPMK